MNDIYLTLKKYRLEQSEKTLKDAKVLRKNQGENYSVINRCYYSIFYSVLALLVDSDFVGSKHYGVISYFDKYFVKTGIFPKELSEIIHKAFKMRNVGDYDEFVEYSLDEISALIKDTEKFIRTIRNFIEESSK
ncbi:MAG: HEPN domain-containing protein [Candidatus Cloacimonetes bacterium]|nr:HEPN domain-containing protein [Candidatus Cloacimonadota bacterium]